MNIRKHTLFVVAMLLAVMLPLSARDLSLAEALECAMQESISLKTAEVDLATAERAYKIGFGAYLPNIQASSTLVRQNENVSAKSMGGMMSALGVPSSNLPSTDPTSAFAGNISASFSFNPAMISAIKSTRESYKAGLISYDDTKAQLNVTISKLYYGIVLQQEALRIQENTLAAQKERMDQAEIDYKNGIVPEISFLSNSVTYENSKIDVEEARAALVSAKRQFAFLIGLGEEDINLTDKIDSTLFSFDENEMVQSISSRYDIRLLKAQSAALDLQRRALVEGTYIPSVAVSAGWQPTISDIKKEWGPRDNWIDNGSVSVTLAWNLTSLLPFSGSGKNIKDLKDAQKKMNLGIQALEKSARIEIMDLLDTIDMAENSLRTSERTIELAKASYEMASESYRAGITSLLDVRDAENQLFSAELGRLSNQYAYLSALIDLEYATGHKIR